MFDQSKSIRDLYYLFTFNISGLIKSNEIECICLIIRLDKNNWVKEKEIFHLAALFF
jgi:hypothetical protein